MANTHTIKITLEVEYDATAISWEDLVENLSMTPLDDAEIVDYDYTEAKSIQHEPPDDTHNDF